MERAGLGNSRRGLGTIRPEPEYRMRSIVSFRPFLVAVVLRPEHLATGFGMFYTIFYLGLAVAQPLAGLTRDMSGDPAMPIFFAAALMTITLVGLGLFRWVEQLGEGRAPAPRRV